MSDTEPTATDNAPDGGDDEFDWQSFLEDYYSGPQEPDEPAEDSGEDLDPDPAADVEELEGDVEPPSPAAPPQDTPPAPDYIDIAGRQVPTSAAEQLSNLYDFIDRYPEQAAQFSAYLNGQYDLVPRGQGSAPAQPPEEEPPIPAPPPLRDEDLEYLPDPVRERIRAIDAAQERLDRMERAMGEYSQVAQLQYEQVQAERARAAQSAINAGTTAFREEYDLSEEDMTALQQDAAKLGVVERLAEEYNDPIRAVKETLELAYLRNPDYREREFARREQQLQDRRKKDKKLGAISGSGGSVTRSSTPSTPEERREAMVREIADAIRGPAS